MRANIIVFLLAMLLSGCGGGSSGANGTDPFGGSTDPVVALSIDILDSNCAAVAENTFTTDQSICVQATLTSDGSAFSGQVVSFALSAAIGTIDDGTALTDSTGVAQVIISNDAATTGATTITATYNTSLTASESFEYTPADEPPVVVEPEPTISLEMIVNGINSNRFRVGENVALRSTVLDGDGVPVADEIVNFSVASTAFTIAPDTSLTDATGTARATMSAVDSGVGAHVLNASVTLNAIEYTNSVNFELLQAEPGLETRVLSLAILNANCEADDQSFGTNETICVIATLTQNDAPLQNEIITFTGSTGLGTLSASTALTDSNGEAEIFITNSAGSVGAASLTATIDTLSDSQNFEYVAVSETVTSSPTVKVEVIVTGSPVNGFQAGQEALVRATVTTPEGEPIRDVIVTFAVQGTGPVLTPTTGLTNASGVTEVNIGATESDLGAYAVQVQATVDDIQISNSTNFEIRSAGAVVDSETRFGHFNSEGEFVEGIIGSSIANENGDIIISAGATTGFDVALVDENNERIATPTPVSFTSNCVASGDATIDGSVTTINGVASATFEDLSCAGSTGNTDQIVASVVVNNSTITITRDFIIEPEGIGSISFLSATPDSIILSGTGGQNNASVSTLLFQVNGELGNPLAQQEVSFSLNSTIGGLSLDPATSLTNTQGQVSTRVTAGTVPTPVRVTASINTAEGSTIQTQSDILTVNTGLPDQNSFSIGATVLNPEAATRSGTESTIIVRLADAFNNPVPNGTTVSFTTESGSIEGSCRTGEDSTGAIDPEADDNGTCSVTWTSSSPEVPDHRVTILAYAIGHETLFDANGNNAYDDSDGGAILDGTDSGFEVSQYGQIGFVDHSEAWRDDDEDGVWEESEFFFDFNGNESFDTADGLFNGPQCNSATLCDSNASSIAIRRSMVLITSSSSALYRVYGDVANDGVSTFDDANIFETNDSSVAINQNLVDDLGQFILGEGDTVDIYVVYYDTAGQQLAAGTILGTLDSNGSISQQLDIVNNTTRRERPEVPGSVFSLRFQNETDGDTSLTETRSLAIDSPSGTRTSLSFSVSFL